MDATDGAAEERDGWAILFLYPCFLVLSVTVTGAPNSRETRRDIPSIQHTI